MGTFHWSSSGDGIWFDAWVPKSEGAYIGACFGLLFFATLSRGLPALEAYFIAWKRLRDNRIAGNQLVALQPNTVKTDVEKSANSTDDSSSQSFNPNAYPISLRLPIVPPFSWSTDTVRSFLTAFSSFVSYLLMMVVMTGNGGFFVVIVVGVFLGEMVFGRFRALGGLLDDHVH
ncbi:Ctr copper transporter [Parasitella parasitica]|nr:Ctr copper transporter [Parasitella parasitica]